MNYACLVNLHYLFEEIYCSWENDRKLLILYFNEIEGFIEALFLSNIISFEEKDVYRKEALRVFVN